MLYSNSLHQLYHILIESTYQLPFLYFERVSLIKYANKIVINVADRTRNMIKPLKIPFTTEMKNILINLVLCVILIVYMVGIIILPVLSELF